MKGCQLTFDDVLAERYISHLTQKQIDIIRFLKEGYYQAFIARRMKISRGYVNETVKTLEKYNLVTPLVFRYPDQKTGRIKIVATGDHLHGRATTYAVSDRLDALIRKKNPYPDGQYILCSPHHKKIKYPIHELKGDWDLHGWRRDRCKSIHIRTWKPKGPERNLWHVNTPNGVIGIEAHPGTLIAYRVSREHILAKSVEESEQLLTAYIQAGVDTWMKEQERAGVRAELGGPISITKPHYAFESEIAKQIVNVGGGIRTEGMFVDNSLEKLGNDTACEIETTNPSIASQVDRGLRAALNMDTIVETQVQAAITGAIPAIISSVSAQLSGMQDQISDISEQLHQGNQLQEQFSTVMSVLQQTISQLNDIKQAAAAPAEEPAPPPVRVMSTDTDMMYQ